MPCALICCEVFQYLGSRGAQHPNLLNPLRINPFQYLGSRGAQLFLSTVRAFALGFNTWAREEPNGRKKSGLGRELVSILGLARSPTV